MAESRKLSAIEQSLLDLLANNLFDCGRSVSVCADDWLSVWQEAYSQTVPLSIFTNGIDEGVPEELAMHIRGKIGELVLSVSRRIGEHMLIHRLLTQAGIKYTIIKGFACSLYYPDPLLRLLGDVDFLVEPEDEEKTAELLLSKGFTEISTIGESHRVFNFRGCRYELHTEPVGIPSGEMGEVVEAYLQGIVENAESKATDFGQLNVPSEFHHGLIMLLHISHHLNGEGIGLRHLCDWAVFVAHLGGEQFKALFEKPLKDMGLWRFALILTDAGIRYLGCGASLSDAIDLSEISAELMKDIFVGGNLGQKSDNRAHEALVLSSENADNGYVKNLFNSANRIVYKNWSFCRRVKILLPIGWLFFGLRYAFRSLKGERPHIDLKEIKDEAVKRKELYSRLQLFEKENNNENK